MEVFVNMKEIDIRTLTVNPFDRLHKQWALLSSGTPGDFNMMTVSWGALGVIWQKPSCTVYVRQSRYTKEFIDKNECFTLSFLKDGHREALNLLGSQSGRDLDKMTESGLTPVFVDGCPTFAEAELVLVCRKVYALHMPVENFFDPAIAKANYADGDTHTQYIGEIIAAYEN